MGLRNIHVTYLLRDKLLNTKLPLPNVCEPLIILEAEGGFFWKERQHSAFRKGTRQLPILVSIPHICSSDFLSTTNNNYNTTTREDTRTLGHHLVNTSTEGSSFFSSSYLTFRIKNMAKMQKNIFYNTNLSFSSESQKC